MGGLAVGCLGVVGRFVQPRRREGSCDGRYLLEFGIGELVGWVDGGESF